MAGFSKDSRLHDVAPVAGGIADAEEDGFIFRLGLFEGFRAPGIPVDGVVGVLEEVGAGLVGESVGHGASGGFSPIVHQEGGQWPVGEDVGRGGEDSLGTRNDRWGRSE